jgi:hypothetical protein
MAPGLLVQQAMIAGAVCRCIDSWQAIDCRCRSIEMVLRQMERDAQKRCFDKVAAAAEKKAAKKKKKKAAKVYLSQMEIDARNAEVAAAVEKKAAKKKKKAAKRAANKKADKKKKKKKKAAKKPQNKNDKW